MPNRKTRPAAQTLNGGPASMDSYASFWKVSTIDLPLMLWSESLRFMSHRLQAQAEQLGALSRCKSVSEALESQAEFTRTAMSEYAAEANTLMQEARMIAKQAEAA